jgi:hypothetical protein
MEAGYRNLQFREDKVRETDFRVIICSSYTLGEHDITHEMYLKWKAKYRKNFILKNINGRDRMAVFSF